MGLIKRALIICLLLLTLPCLYLSAQDEDEYKMELGGALGGMIYWICWKIRGKKQKTGK